MEETESAFSSISARVTVASCVCWAAFVQKCLTIVLCVVLVFSFKNAVVSVLVYSPAQAQRGRPAPLCGGDAPPPPSPAPQHFRQCLTAEAFSCFLSDRL